MTGPAAGRSGELQVVAAGDRDRGGAVSACVVCHDGVCERQGSAAEAAAKACRSAVVGDSGVDNRRGVGVPEATAAIRLRDVASDGDVGQRQDAVVVDAGAMNVAKKCLAIRRTDRVPAFNRQPADAHDGYWADRGVAVADIDHAEIRICLLDDSAAHARAVEGQVLIDEEMADSERVGAGRHSNSIGAAARGAGIDGSIRVGRLDWPPAESNRRRRSIHQRSS